MTPAVKNRTNLQREASILFVAAVLFRQGRRGKESTRILWSLSPGTPEVKNRKGALRARLKRSSVRLSSRDKWCDSTTEMREGKSSMVRGQSYSSNTGGRSEDGPWMRVMDCTPPSTDTLPPKGRSLIVPQKPEPTTCAVYISGRLNGDTI